MAKLDDLDKFYNTVAAEKKKVDIVVASAGFIEFGFLGSVTPEHFEKTFNINTRGAFFTVQKALPIMNNGGSIILIASCVHLKGIPQYTVYSATEAALRSFARAWAAELKDRQIRVNRLSSGVTDRPIIAPQLATKEEAGGARAMFAQMIPLGRPGRPEERIA